MVDFRLVVLVDLYDGVWGPPEIAIEKLLSKNRDEDAVGQVSVETDKECAYEEGGNDDKHDAVDGTEAGLAPHQEECDQSDDSDQHCMRPEPEDLR